MISSTLQTTQLILFISKNESPIKLRYATYVLWFLIFLAYSLGFYIIGLFENMHIFWIIASIFRIHDFLKRENEIGNITRQEAVSMVNIVMCPCVFQLIEFVGNSAALSTGSTSFPGREASSSSFR